MPGRPRKRPNRQQIAAEATRLEILRAARRLFAEKGYAATSIVDIAEAAGVSVPTLYTSIGPKKSIVIGVAGFIGEEAGASDAMERIARETSPRAVIALGAHVNRNLVEKCGDILRVLVSASHVEEDAARAVEFGRQMHRAGAERIAARLGELGALKPGLSTEEASDVLTLLTGVEAFEILVRRCGWSLDRAESWLVASLASLLLD